MMYLKRDVGMNLDRKAGMNQESPAQLSLKKCAILSQGKSVILWQKNILIMLLLRSVALLIFLYADLYLERNVRIWKKLLPQLYQNKTATRSQKRFVKMWLMRFV